MKTAFRTSLSRLLLAGVTATALAACTNTPMPQSAVERHAIQVAESIERLEIYPRQDGLELTAKDRGAMNAFLAGYHDQGHGPVYLNSPASGSQGIRVAQSQVRQAMSGLGLANVGVQEGNYQTLPGAPAPLVVSYRKLRTLVPNCDAGSEDLTSTFYNTPSPNWGCAYHANIAAMVADPNQFIEPYGMTDPSSRRRMVVYDKYIQGQPTGARRPGDEDVSSQDLGN